jgi:molybdenum cofactor cytidylyltransferase
VAIAVQAARHLRSQVPVLAVVRPGADALAAALRGEGCEVVVCENAAAGMGASLACGARAAAGAEAWLVALGDMPFVRPSTMQALIAALAHGAGIAAPSFQGRRGNPVAFSREHLPDLLKLGGDQGARDLLRRFPVADVAVDDAGIAIDIDVPTDLVLPR